MRPPPRAIRLAGPRQHRCPRQSAVPMVRHRREAETTPPRRGSILVVVLVVIVLLTLSAYHYSTEMLAESESVAMAASEAQARAMVDSGAEYVAALLANRLPPGEENLQHDPARFQGVIVQPSDRPRAQGRFTILAPVEQDATNRAVRYGLIDESSKLNVNLLDRLNLTDEQSRKVLMGLPGMTESIADAIRDWIDADDSRREYGAESELYEARPTPYKAKNGPIETLEELLLVEGVTPDLLYGEDANRNGLLDPNENDGPLLPPFDNADGVLQLGWSAFLTVCSKEANIRADGSPRIDLNNGFLTDLYDQLLEEFGEDVAKFVVAFRMAGPKDARPADASTAGLAGAATSSSAAGQQQQQQQMVQQVATAIAGAMSQGQGSVTRGGMDLSKGGQYRITSMWELIGSRTDATVNGSKTTLNSPWPADTGQLASLLPTLVDALSTSGDEAIDGRINLNQARYEVLIGLPDMTEELALAIIAASPTDASGAPLIETVQNRSTSGWLYLEGLVDIWQMRSLDAFLTTRGHVFRAQICGFFDGGGPVVRAEALIDGAQRPPRIIGYRDLTGFGRGYRRAQLLPTAEP